MSQIISINNNKALSFLNNFRNHTGTHNLVAIHPQSGKVTGITRPVGHADLLKFLEQHNNSQNLYFTVNEPRPDAPDDKLKKTDIEKVSAVWLDADPAKDKDFNEERDRLHVFADKLKTELAHPPTYITDSGGGIQAFWLLDEPLTIEATKDIIHYESLSRGLADQYDTDRVHNIDRIMRIPFTVNLPTKKKKNRKPAMAQVLHASSPTGTRYPDPAKFITPTFVKENDDEFESTDLSMPDIRKPIPNQLMKKFKAHLNNNPKLHDLYFGLIEKPSRSEYDFTLTKELKWLDFSLQETAHILYHFAHGKNKDLTSREIIRCYNRTENPFDDLDQDYIEQIEKQTNPILAAREQGKPLDIDLDQSSRFRSKPLHELDWRYSGNPIYKDFLYDKAISVCYGQSNVGKSFVAADIAGHIALGMDWGKLKYKPKIKGTKNKRNMMVVYIAAEAGASFGKRGKALRKRLGVDKLPFHVIDAAPNFATDKTDAKLIIEEIKRLEAAHGMEVGLVVVDTLATTFEGGNENSSEDMGMYISNMKYIQRYGDVGVLIVHHSGKDQAAGARGHSSLRAATDTEIEVLSEKKGENYNRYIKTRKQREGESDKIIRFGLHVVELGKDEDDDPIDTCHVVLEDDQEFENVVPNIFDNMTKNEKDILKAIYYYQKLGVNPDMIGGKRKFSEKQIKAIMFRDLNNGDGVLGLCNGTNDLSAIGVMEHPKRGVLVAMERAWNSLAEGHEGLISDKYQILSETMEQMEQAWNNENVPKVS
jgi:hypothetical protein